MAENTKGKIKEAAGWAFGDRKVEAEGRVEQSESSTDDQAAVESAIEDVRRDHSDIDD